MAIGAAQMYILTGTMNDLCYHCADTKVEARTIRPHLPVVDDAISNHQGSTAKIIPIGRINTRAGICPR